MSNKSDNGVAAWKVASLLINDQTLILEWEIFYSYLGLHSETRIENRNSFNTGSITPFALLHDIIREWVSENGGQATLKALGEALKNTRRNACYEELHKTFPNYDAVITINETGYDPTEDEIRQYENAELRAKTAPGGISILEVMPHKQPGHGRVQIIISYLLDILSKIGNKPVAIISINGRIRLGKSFLATQMVKYLKSKGDRDWIDTEMSTGFTVTHSEERVTSGIQVWHEPLHVVYEGKTISVIILDTQGLHDINTGAQEKAAIFGLSALLSSVFIYNEITHEDDPLQELRAFLEFDRYAGGGDEPKIGVEGSKIHSTEGQLKFQKLTLLLRDRHSSKEYESGYYDDNHCPYGEVENLKKAIFDIPPGLHENEVETRDGIKRCFEEISIYAMGGPENSYHDIPEYTHSSSWHSEFRDFIEKILSPQSLPDSTKKVFGKEVTGEELKVYVSKWAELIHATDGVIEPQTILRTTTKLYYKNIIDAAPKEYQNKMNEYFSQVDAFDSKVFQEFHLRTKEGLESKFTSEGAYGENCMLNKYKAKLHEQINRLRDQFVSRLQFTKQEEGAGPAEKSRSINENDQNLNYLTNGRYVGDTVDYDDENGQLMKKATDLGTGAKQSKSGVLDYESETAGENMFITMKLCKMILRICEDDIACNFLSPIIIPSQMTNGIRHLLSPDFALNIASPDKDVVKIGDFRTLKRHSVEKGTVSLHKDTTSRTRVWYGAEIKAMNAMLEKYEAKPHENVSLVRDGLETESKWPRDTNILSILQKKYLQENLIDLVRLTRCTKSLLEYLVVNGALQDNDIKFLMAGDKSEHERTFDLYEILLDRMDVYNVLRDGILLDNQIESYRILQKFSNKYEIDALATVFTTALEDVERFVRQDPSTSFIIISTLFRWITKVRMINTMSQTIAVYNYKFGSIKSQLNGLPNGMVLAITCKKVKSILNKIGDTSKRVILITELEFPKLQEIANSCQPTPNVAKENISWKDLHRDAQELLLKQHIVIQTKVTRLRDLSCVFQLDQIEGKLLFDLLDGTCPELIKNNVPALPNYYLKRELSTARIISPDIFRNESNDIFAIKGIQLEELRNQCGGKEVEKSSNQLYNQSCQFIQLDADEHYETICKLTDQPAHLLSYEDGKFIWVRSKGCRNIILEHMLQQEPVVMDEDNFTQECISARHPVIISGARGMGKSTLLSKLGNTLLNKKSIGLVLYIAFRDLIPKLKYCTAGTIYDQISNSFSDYELGRQLVLAQLKSRNRRCYILFDAHYETATKHLNEVNQLMRIISECKPELDNTQIIIATGPTFGSQDTPEEIFGTPVFNMAPLNDKSQVEFLLHQWKQPNLDVLNAEKGQGFGGKCPDNDKNDMQPFGPEMAEPTFCAN